MPVARILPLADSVAPALFLAAWVTVQRPRPVAWLLVAAPILVVAVLLACAILLSALGGMPASLRGAQGEIETLISGIASILTAIACGPVVARLSRSRAGTARSLG